MIKWNVENGKWKIENYGLVSWCCFSLSCCTALQEAA
jgi:hypothetical protein